MHTDRSLEITPWVPGARTTRRVVVRLVDEPAWIWLNFEEYAALESLTRDRPNLDDWLASHISGTTSLGFKNATSLLLKLHQAGFIKHASPETLEQLKVIGQAPVTPTSALVQSFKKYVQKILNLDVVQFKHATTDTLVQTVGRSIVSPLFIGAAAVVAGLTAWTVANDFPRLPLEDLVRTPESLMLQLIVMFSISATLNGLTHFVALAGSNVRFIGGSIKLTGLCILRFSPDDRDAAMLPQSLQIRYRLITLGSPWIWMLLCLGASTTTLTIDSPRSILAASFGAIGLLSLCPLFRSPIVKTAEGLAVSRDILEMTREFLSRNLFTGHAKSSAQEDRITNVTTVVFACIALLWLYGAFLAFSSATIALTPALWTSATDIGNPLRALSAAMMLGAVTVFALAPAYKLSEILMQNMVAASSLPVRRARQSILSYKSSGLSASDAVVQFLRNVPILGHMDDHNLRRLVEVMHLREIKTGELIIKQGEPGDSFFIMALGQAQVVRENPGGRHDILDVVEPGDSFGEIALLEKTTRTATVRANTNSKVLVLSKRNFDVVFPEGSEDRKVLTAIIRQAKLIVSSQGLSHLAPKQVRELLHYIKPVEFKAGDILIKEGTEGDDVYLIESGKVEVTKRDSPNFNAQLGRGDLVGLIAVVSKVPRTATVRALEHTKALRIDGATFMRMCRSNIIVATVMSDLSQTQMQDANRLGRAS